MRGPVVQQVAPYGTQMGIKAMDALSQLEKKYQFTLPTAYRSFYERGYLTYPGDAYLWVHEAEWLSPTEILDRGGFWGNPKPGLVAFAFNGRRDLWAWQTQRISEVGEPWIVHCPRDCYEGSWVAPSFLGWFYRVSLEYANWMWEEESESKQRLHRWASVLREFEKGEWADDIESIAHRKVMVTKSGLHDEYISNSLISGWDVGDRIRAAFGKGFVEAPYIWDIDGEPKAR